MKYQVIVPTTVPSWIGFACGLFLLASLPRLTLANADLNQTPPIQSAEQDPAHPPGKLTGVVRDSQGKAVADAHLFFQKQFKQEVTQTRSDAEGNFQLDIDWEAGQRPHGHLWCTARGFNLKCVAPVSTHWAGKACTLQLTPEDSIPVQILAPNGSTKSMVKVIPYQYQVPNGVYESEMATGLIGIIPDAVGAELAVVSGDDGATIIRGVEAKHLDHIRVQQATDLPQSVPWKIGQPSLVIHPSGRIRGQLRGGDPSDYSKWRVMAVSSQNAEWLRHDASTFVPVAADGSFQVDGMIAGQLKVSLVRDDQETCPTHIATPVPAKKIEAGKTIQMDVQMKAAVILRGRLLLEDTRQPVANAKVFIVGQSRSQNVMTDEQGEYRVSVLPGQCQIQVTFFNRTSQPYDYPPLVVINVPNGSVEFVAPELLMAPYLSREVEVLDALGNPVANRYLYLVDQEFGHVVAMGKLDQEGVCVVRFPKDEVESFNAPTSHWRLGDAEREETLDRRQLPLLEVLPRELSDDNRLILVIPKGDLF